MTTLESVNLDLARRYFDFTRDRVVGATQTLSETQLRFKPAADRWSIAENLEHIVVVQERILDRLREQFAEAPAPAADRDNERIDEIIFEKVPERSMKAKAPVFTEPAGTLTLAESLNRLFQNNKLLTEFVESTPDLRDHVLDSPPLKIITNGEFDTMDGYQWALTVAAHNERHVRQIEEVKADPNYPAN